MLPTWLHFFIPGKLFAQYIYIVTYRSLTLGKNKANKFKAISIIEDVNLSYLSHTSKNKRVQYGNYMHNKNPIGVKKQGQVGSIN